MGSIRQILRPFKASLHHRTKYARYYLQGHASYYASTQDPSNTAFPHPWSKITIRIKLRNQGAEVDRNRISNMQLAASFFDGLIVNPDEIISFWRQVPAPRPHNQFKPGPTLIKGKLAFDYGGGLCQISTALFKVFIRSGFEIIERHSHSIDAYGLERYFVLGQDSAVAYGYKDLIVRNTSDVPIQLRIKIDEHHPIVEAGIYGQAAMPYSIRLETALVEVLKASDRKGKSGWRVETTRKYFTGEDQMGRINYQRLDTYQPHNG